MTDDGGGMSPKLIPIERLRAVLDYDPATGVLTWKPRQASQFADARRWNARYAGKPAGTVGDSGYVRVRVDRVGFKAHRVAWALMTGEQPAGEIDHINGVRADNRWSNLRDVDNATNRQNQRRARPHNKTGLLGVTWVRRLHKFQAAIRAGGKRVHLGLHDTPEAAHAAYIAAKRELHEGCTL